MMAEKEIGTGNESFFLKVESIYSKFMLCNTLMNSLLPLRQEKHLL